MAESYINYSSSTVNMYTHIHADFQVMKEYKNNELYIPTYLIYALPVTNKIVMSSINTSEKTVHTGAKNGVVVRARDDVVRTKFIPTNEG